MTPMKGAYTFENAKCQHSIDSDLQIVISFAAATAKEIMMINYHFGQKSINQVSTFGSLR